MPGDALPSVVGLVAAAGRGERFGAGVVPKQFQPIAGRPLLAWSLDRLLDSGVPRVFVAVPPEWVARAPKAILDDPRVSWLAGGATRQESVELCLIASRPGFDRPAAAATVLASAVPGEELVLVHDGARPATAIADIRTTVEAAARAGAAVLGRPLDDTLKRLLDGRVVETLPRADLFRAETPQVFRRSVLTRAYERANVRGLTATDEAGLVEGLGDVVIEPVEASEPNPKLTRLADRRWIELLLAGLDEAPEVR